MGRPVTDLTGLTFGRLTALEYAAPGMWRCLCICGQQTIAQSVRLQTGRTKSCGCLRASGPNLKHGHSHPKRSPEYTAWKGLRERCRPHYSKSEHYGERGIKVCERWESFVNFLADMGKRPPGCNSIDRIDNDGNYEPGNCRWATREMQNGNRRPFKRGKK